MSSVVHPTLNDDPASQDARGGRSRDRLGRVLVIDDDASHRAVLVAQLVHAGYRARGAEDGTIGLIETRAFRPDVVLCDWLMPNCDGPSYCRAVKSDPELQATYIAMLTGRADPEALVEGLDAGADDFIVKPLALDELLARVRAAMRIRRLQDQVVEAQRREMVVEMAVTLGHEVNNPLTALLGHLELIQRYMEADEPDRVQHHVERSRHVADRIAEVARALRELRHPKMKPYLGEQQMFDLFDEGKEARAGATSSGEGHVRPLDDGNGRSAEVA